MARTHKSQVLDRGRMSSPDLSQDHFDLEDTRVTRRYFGKFAKITQHLNRVAASMHAESRLSRFDIEAIAGYLSGLN